MPTTDGLLTDIKKRLHKLKEIQVCLSKSENWIPALLSDNYDKLSRTVPSSVVRLNSFTCMFSWSTCSAKQLHTPFPVHCLDIHMSSLVFIVINSYVTSYTAWSFWGRDWLNKTSRSAHLHSSFPKKSSVVLAEEHLMTRYQHIMLFFFKLIHKCFFPACNFQYTTILTFYSYSRNY